MIAVTRLDGTPMVVNSDQIAWIEFRPDTVISLNNGEKLIVRGPLTCSSSVCATSSGWCSTAAAASCASR